MEKLSSIVKKGRALLGAAILAMVLLPQSVRAFTTLDATVAEGDKTPVARRVQFSTSTRQLGNDMAAFTLFYVGTATEAVVSVTQTALTFYAPAGTVDTSIGTAGVLTLTTAQNSTIGGLCDAINATTNYDCIMRDARRSDNSTLLQDQTFAVNKTDLNLKGPGGYAVAFDTGGVTNTASSTAPFLSLGITPIEGKRIVLKSCKLNVISGSGYPKLTVSGVLRREENINDGLVRNDSSLVWSQVLGSSNTDVNVLFYDTTGGSPTDGGIRFGYSNSPIPGPANAGGPSGVFGLNAAGRVVVRVDIDAPNSVNAGAGGLGSLNAPSFLQCYWIEK